MKLQQGAPSAREPAVSAGTNQEAGPGCSSYAELQVALQGWCLWGQLSLSRCGGRGRGLKMEPEAHCGGNMRAASEDAGAVASAADTARGSHSVPGGAPARPADAITHGVPGGVGDLNNPRGPSAAGESDGTVGVIPQLPGAPQVPGPGRDAAPGAGVLSNRPLQLYPIQEPRWAGRLRCSGCGLGVVWGVAGGGA